MFSDFFCGKSNFVQSFIHDWRKELLRGARIAIEINPRANAGIILNFFKSKNQFFLNHLFMTYESTTIVYWRKEEQMLVLFGIIYS